MDVYEERRKTWEDLEVTRDELNTITECMKKDDFRKLLVDYAEEVSDPENRKIYQSEITQLERERGVDITFVNPEPGYVIKTSLDGRVKCFLNIGKSEHVGKPTSQRASEATDGGVAAGGLNWSIPYLLTPARDDLDKSRTRCRVFDVIFHPDTLYLAERNSRFRQMVSDTALDGVEKSFKIQLDRKNLKFPKMSFKGYSQPAVIRKPCEKPSKEEKLDMEPEIYQKLMSSYDENRDRWLKTKEPKATRAKPTTKYYKKRVEQTEDETSMYTTPKFLIKHQTSHKMEEFLEAKDAKIHSAIPENLVIVVNLPLLKSIADAKLDVQERHLSLKSEKPAKYNLELPLSYRINPDKGNAKFDSKLRMLTVTLPVIRDVLFLSETKEDSGVESDHGSPIPEPKDVNNQLVNEDVSDSQESDEKSIICVSSDNDKVQSDCDDTALRTSNDSKISVPFMNPNVKYLLPTFTCNLYDNVLAITIHAKNVDSESICQNILRNNTGLHVIFTSVGAGFFPVNYSLCLKIEDNTVQPDSLIVEPWDNNVVLSIKINNVDTVSRYYAGLDEESMEPKELSIAASIKYKLQALIEDPELETDKNVEVIRNNSEVIVNVQSECIDSDDEDDQKDKSNSKDEQRKRNTIQSRLISESSGDELVTSTGNRSQKYKSILKSHHGQFSRSVSESSIDDNNVAFNNAILNDSVNDFNSESEGSKLKKTVHFNNVVYRYHFRLNSSILGQRKKNQRKNKNKRRANERRLSESETSETDAECDKYRMDVKNESEQQNENLCPV